jgi:hypothetical protein
MSFVNKGFEDRLEFWTEEFISLRESEREDVTEGKREEKNHKPHP